MPAGDWPAVPGMTYQEFRLPSVAANAWRCGTCGGSVSGYWSAEDAAEALERHMERCHAGTSREEGNGGR